MNKEQINKKIYSILKQVEEDKTKIQELAQKKMFYLNLDEKDTIYKHLRKQFKFIVLDQRFNFRWDGNKYESLTNNIYNIQNNQEYYFLNLIGFEKINDKKQIITLRKSELYYLNTFKEVFGVDFEKETVKEYVNGKVDIKFNSDDVYNIFKEIVNFANPQTTKVIKSITNEDRNKYKNYKKEKYMNIYNIIYEIKERIGLNYHMLNYYKIFEELKKGVKK